MRGLRASFMLAFTVAPASAQQPSVQQQFDAASAALNAEKWAEALTIFETLEKQLAPNGRSASIVRVRKAEALIGLDRASEARAALELGLPALPADDESLREDRLIGLLALGRLHERSLNFGEALVHYRAADMIATVPTAKAQALRGLIATNMFYDGAAALRDADRALALAAAEPKADKLHAEFHVLKGRVLMNQKRFAEARAELEAATKALGGLTLKVDAADLAARSDLAIAALLAGDKDRGREVLAYTGAGRLPGAFSPGADTPPPPCASDGDLRPDDVAVVEFSIRNDGSIGHVAPIYSTREGDSALAFARAAANWSWSPEEMKEIPPLLRLLTRVEMRCSAANEQPSATEILEPDFEQWLASRALPPIVVPAGSDARRAQPLAEEVARREASYGASAPELLPVLVELADNAVIPANRSAAYYRRAAGIARIAAAPAPVLAYLGIRAATAETMTQTKRWSDKVPDLRPLLNDPAIQADPRAAVAVRLVEAENRYRIAGQKAQAIALLTQVRDAPGLGPNDPLRAAALARLASVQLADGDAGAARASFAASGLSAQQCALLDAQPRLKRMNASSSDFPMEAMRWGFEGWAALEYDISAQGDTQAVRTTIAYPPFVFSDAASKVVKGMKFDRSFRPDGALGCGGKTQRVLFRLPD